MNSTCTGGKKGLPAYFILKSSFHNYIVQSIEERGDDEECREQIRRNPLPPGLMQDAIETVLQNRMTGDEICSFLESVNRKLDTYFCFDFSGRDEYEFQAQIVLKKTDGAYVATNILKIQKVDGIWQREGFGNVNRLNFDLSEDGDTQSMQRETNPVNTTHGKESTITTQETNTRSNLGSEQTHIDTTDAVDKQRHNSSRLTEKNNANTKQLGGLTISLIVISCIVGAVLLSVFIRYQMHKK